MAAEVNGGEGTVREERSGVGTSARGVEWHASIKPKVEEESKAIVHCTQKNGEWSRQPYVGVSLEHKNVKAWE